MTIPGSLKQKAGKVLWVLKKLYPDSRCSLQFASPFQLLIATILSAQCTDERVNKVTPGLFRKYPTPRDFAGAAPGELEEAIRPTGFFRNKARSIQACAEGIVKAYGGEVPDNVEKLVKLRGVGRKTANVVLGNAFGKPAVVIETHVLRIAARLGLTREKDPVKMELEFGELFPKKDWSHLAHLFIDHGRAVCKAPTPKCGLCKLTHLCDYYQSQMENRRAATT